MKQLKLTNSNIIKSVSSYQEEILLNIMKLYEIDRFDLDPTYSSGNFYKHVPEPRFKLDLLPQTKDTIQANVVNLPIKSNTINSIVFDPPFLCTIPSDKPEGIIIKRFGYYRNTQDYLWLMYWKAMVEFKRIMKEDAILVFKCQDAVESSKQYLNHIEIINNGIQLGMYPRDLFILLAKNRLIRTGQRSVHHARKFHSYFIVFINRGSPVRYNLYNSNINKIDK